MDRPHDIKFLIGSKVFFNLYSDFKPHDDDLLILQSDENDLYDKYCYISLKGLCINYWKLFTPQEFINIHLEFNNGILFGKFLVPDFVHYIGFTIKDLKLLKPLLKLLDDKHKYQEIIYNAYIENNDFILTDKLRLKAYNSYKESRNDSKS